MGRAEHDPVAGRDVDEIQIDPGCGDPAGEVGELARTVLDVDDDDLALAADREARDRERVTHRLRVAHEDVQLRALRGADAGRGGEVDAGIADRRHHLGQRARCVLDLDYEIERDLPARAAYYSGPRVVDDSDRLLEQTRAFNAELERLLATLPSVHTVAPEVTRRVRREGTGAFPAPVYLEQARTLTIDGPAGPLAIRVLLPAGGAGRGAFLHIHGGGWTFGDHDMQDPRLQRLADETGLTVLSVG